MPRPVLRASVLTTMLWTRFQSPFHREGTWIETLSNLSKVTELVGGRFGIWIHVVCFHTLILNPKVHCFCFNVTSYYFYCCIVLGIGNMLKWFKIQKLQKAVDWKSLPPTPGPYHPGPCSGGSQHGLFLGQHPKQGPLCYFPPFFPLHANIVHRIQCDILLFST